MAVSPRPDVPAFSSPVGISLEQGAEGQAGFPVLDDGAGQLRAGALQPGVSSLFPLDFQHVLTVHETLLEDKVRFYASCTCGFASARFKQMSDLQHCGCPVKSVLAMSAERREAYGVSSR